MTVDEERGSTLSLEFSRFSMIALDEFKERRKPCTRGESGFLRGSDWVLRTFIRVPWKLGLTS